MCLCIRAEEKGGDCPPHVQARLVDVRAVQASRGAFVALLGDGSAVAWGSARSGGDSSGVEEQLRQDWDCKDIRIPARRWETVAFTLQIPERWWQCRPPRTPSVRCLWMAEWWPGAQKPTGVTPLAPNSRRMRRCSVCRRWDCAFWVLGDDGIAPFGCWGMLEFVFQKGRKWRYAEVGSIEWWHVGIQEVLEFVQA